MNDALRDQPASGILLKPAAQYIRMSTEHQKYSTENQQAAIEAYAHLHGMKIVRTYLDSGKSGLRFQGRGALKQLIADVSSGEANFECILVLDVSRWGRFQDADESAYYEFICRQAGVDVRYCAEPFENDGSLSASLIKSIKRLMAGEYSRELSVKVFAAQSRHARLGFKQGSSPGYGLRRLLTDGHGKLKGILTRGQRKAMLSDKVILVPGPVEEVQVIHEIFHLFVSKGKTRTEIARILNERGRFNEFGRPWTHLTVTQVLTNEKYVGNIVYNRVSFKLRQRHIKNPPEAWVRAEGAFEPLIDKASFRAARRIVIDSRTKHLNNEEMLARLRSCLAKHGRLNAAIIDDSDGLPCSRTYQERFGSLQQAYALIGYSSGRPFRVSNRLQGITLSIRHKVIKEIVELIGKSGFGLRAHKGGLLTLEGSVSISVNAASCDATGGWDFRPRQPPSDLTVATRIKKNSIDVLDYFVFPKGVLKRPNIRLASTNRTRWNDYRFKSLEVLPEFVGRLQDKRAAALRTKKKTRSKTRMGRRTNRGA
jgi:DNA invertase Pin-like site-specific DNA recombinase